MLIIVSLLVVVFRSIFVVVIRGCSIVLLYILHLFVTPLIIHLFSHSSTAL